MDWISITILVLFAVFASLCVLITLVGLPGTWVMVGVAIAIALLNPLWNSEDPIWGWVTIGIVLGLAVCGEIIETLAAGLGAKAGGGTKRGMIGAILGSMIGAFVCTFFIPIPLVGTLIGAIVGAFAGALLGELSHKEPITKGELAKSATGAAIGRVMGIIGKTGIAAICWCVLLISPVLFWGQSPEHATGDSPHKTMAVIAIDIGDSPLGTVPWGLSPIPYACL